MTRLVAALLTVASCHWVCACHSRTYGGLRDGNDRAATEDVARGTVLHSNNAPDGGLLPRTPFAGMKHNASEHPETQLILEPNDPQQSPPHVVVRSVHVAQTMTCVVVEPDNRVLCWGNVAGAFPEAATPIPAAKAISPAASGPLAQFTARNCYCMTYKDRSGECWGFDQSGKCSESKGHIRIAAPLDILSLGLGTRHACAILQRGRVRCWGYNQAGQVLGHLTNYRKNEFVPTENPDVELGGKAIQLSVGGYHSCALLDSGTIRCWGEGAFGKLGYGDARSVGGQISPAKKGDVSLPLGAVQVSAGYESTCAVLTDGSARCWGRTCEGDVRVLDQDASVTPPSEWDRIAFEHPIRSIEVGDGFICAILGNGTLRCWHETGNGCPILGDAKQRNQKPAAWSGGTFPDPCVFVSWRDAKDIAIGGPVKQVSAGGWICAVREDGAVFCWGKNSSAFPLGYERTDDIGDDETPIEAGPVPIGNAHR